MNDREIGITTDRIDVLLMSLSDEALAMHGLIRMPMDRDGVRIRLGDTVYDDSGLKYSVTGILASAFSGGTQNKHIEVKRISDGASYKKYVRANALGHEIPSYESVLYEFAELVKRGVCDKDLISDFAKKMRKASEVN